MTQAEWQQLVTLLSGFGLQVLDVNQKEGTVLLRVPPVAGTSPR